MDSGDSVPFLPWDNSLICSLNTCHRGLKMPLSRELQQCWGNNLEKDIHYLTTYYSQQFTFRTHYLLLYLCVIWTTIYNQLPITSCHLYLIQNLSHKQRFHCSYGQYL